MPTTTFQLTYDPEADALGLWVPAPSSDAVTREVAPGVYVDLTPEGRLAGLQVLDASQHYPTAALARLDSPAHWLTLPEAAREAGLRADSLRRQIRNGRLSARKHGRDWVVSEAALWTYLDRRAPSGRKPASRKGRAIRRAVRERE
ncbi:MAG: DUF2283 domain-containing protein [Gemmatimonadales bacterium]